MQATRVPHRELTRLRLAHQGLAVPTAPDPGAVVRRLGAVQSQDYLGAKWGVGSRMAGASDADVEAAFNAGRILRTHVLRPTWHFVAPEDIRWLLALTGPRVNAGNTTQYRILELDDSVVRRCREVLTRAMQEGRHHTRAECRATLESAGEPMADSRRLGYLMMRLELDGVVCSGVRRGNQQTYALLEERVAPAHQLERDEALGELARRYFTTRGPATLRDFSWWSGLTIADGRRGVEIAGESVVERLIEGRSYWMGRDGPPPARPRHRAHLLPNYDEYFIGFRDRSAFTEALTSSPSGPDPYEALPGHVVSVGGQLVGGWSRTLRARSVAIRFDIRFGLTRPQREAVAAAARRYAAFLGFEPELQPLDHSRNSNKRKAGR